MKKVMIMFLILCLMFFITGCSRTQFLGIPSGYIEAYEYYEEDGFREYDDFAFYVYDSKKNLLVIKIMIK